MRRNAICLLVAILATFANPFHPASETIAAGERDRLDATEIFKDGAGGPGPIDNRYFMPMGGARPALHALSGTMVIPETEISEPEGTRWTFGKFPGVAVQIFRHGDRLIPVTRDIIRASRTANRWNLIFSPGRVWSEPGDRGLSRASFPFVLSNRTWNEAHNGLATFLFDDATVSPLVFQIVQETAPSHKFDTWGRLPISLHRGSIEGQARIAREYDAELKRRLPVRPLSELAAVFGERGAEALQLWPTSGNESASGLVMDGVVYLRECQTRFGPYPYCYEMRHGVYSVTKSLGALVAMLRLARKYGDEVFDLKIADYLSVSGAHDGWKAVTFGDALNMATGIGDASPESTIVFEDRGPIYFRFMARPTAAGKLATAFTSATYPWGPGKRFRYRSMDTFTLAAAMDAFLKSREGPGANIWDMVIKEVLRPIGVFHAPMIHTIETDRSRGIPILGEGIYPTYDDIAKISLLLQNDGRYRGVQLLSMQKVREALHRTAIRGLPFPPGISRFKGFRYHMSLWHLPLHVGPCTIDATKMSGWGGNSVLLLPSGAVAFFIRDGGAPVDAQLAAAVNVLRPEC